MPRQGRAPGRRSPARGVAPQALILDDITRLRMHRADDQDTHAARRPSCGRAFPCAMRSRSYRARVRIVSDELWDRLEPLLPQRERRFRYPGRKPLLDRAVLCGILYVLHTGIQWEYLPRGLGFGSGMTCWRRLRDWNEAGVWQRLHEVLLAELNAAAPLDWSRCVVDSSHVRALKGGSTRARRRLTGDEPTPSIT